MADLPCGCRTEPVRRLCSYHEGYEDGFADGVECVCDETSTRNCPVHQSARIDGPDLCFVLTEDNGSFCGRTLPCPEHNDGGGS